MSLNDQLNQLKEERDLQMEVNETQKNESLAEKQRYE